MLCGICHKQLICRDPLHGPNVAGAAMPKCKSDCAVWVRVTDDRNVPVKGVKVTVDGDTKKTDELGFAGFDDLPPNKQYSAKIALPDEAASKYDPIEEGKETQSGDGVEGQILLFEFRLHLRAHGIDVRVLRKDTRVPVDSAEVRLEETGETKSLGAEGAVSFEPLPEGKYTATVSKARVEGKIVQGLPCSGEASVTEGKRATIELLVDVLDWTITTVVIAGDHAPDGGADGAESAPLDWKITTVKIGGAED